MGRFLVEKTDRAEKLEDWVRNFGADINKELSGAELYDISLFTQDFSVRSKYYFNGFVSIYIKFNAREPQFLTEKDRELWYSRVSETAWKKFAMPCNPSEDHDWVSIHFEEPSEDELYILTPNKELLIKEGFNRIKDFVKWYCSAVKTYEDVVTSHANDLEKYLSSL